MDHSQEHLVALGRQHLYPNYRQPDFVLCRGTGCEVWDVAGNRYLDLTAGIAVTALGHAHPRWVQAVTDQAGRLSHVSNYFFNQPNIELARHLCERTGMARVLFSNSGAEAIEACLKLARRHFFVQGQVDRHRVIAFEQSFHGRTLGALAATGQPGYRDGFGPLSRVTHVPYGDLDAVRRAMGQDVAAILVEPVQGEGGVIPAAPGFIQGLREIADNSGALLLADEIQTGVGRTGTFLGLEHSGVKADAIAMAKGLGGGFPIGAMLCGAHLEAALPPGSHGSTFGGNPLASAAALAVLETVQQENLVERARELGEHLAALLKAAASRLGDRVETTRGLGLLRALVLPSSVNARSVLDGVRARGVLLTAAGGAALRFSPALVITKEQLEEGVSVVESVLSEHS